MSILRLDRIFIPVHTTLHYVCVEVDLQARVLWCYDPLMRTPKDMRAKEALAVTENVARWVEDEAVDKLGVALASPAGQA